MAQRKFFTSQSNEDNAAVFLVGDWKPECDFSTSERHEVVQAGEKQALRKHFQPFNKLIV